tara:strand:+ start:1707 stop:1889 length:183 start_codon:yes stop_codon:yes gene_type:complete
MDLADIFFLLFNRRTIKWSTVSSKLRLLGTGGGIKGGRCCGEIGKNLGSKSIYNKTRLLK